ncbi:hypothetical protein EMIT093MI4_70221 [Pseudomonas sp. IT-93MI4]|uniref:Uncharacterized protein n=1 Tax=Pseudomonas aylmerensis TaxID=1869229 RepID=A0ABX2Z2L6_9PSED|nr:hypothetical protein BBG20_00310 [Pseudomonas aylmerensis]
MMTRWRYHFLSKLRFQLGQGEQLFRLNMAVCFVFPLQHFGSAASTLLMRYVRQSQVGARNR